VIDLQIQNRIEKIVSTLYIFSPPENDSFRKDLCFTADVFFIFFLYSRDLRDAWANRLEILHNFGVEQKKIHEIPSTMNQVMSANVDLP